jgi:ribonuclease-3
VYGNAFEALIGAIYLDKGYEQCKKFVYDVIFAKYISVKKLEKATENFKSQLLEWSQKRKINVDFEIIDDVMDAENNHIFKCAVKIDGKVVANGNGYSKKESQQRAAKAGTQSTKPGNTQGQSQGEQGKITSIKELDSWLETQKK